MLLTLAIDAAEDGGSFTSTAFVAKRTFDALHASWSSYVAVCCRRDDVPVVFRLAISDAVAADTLQIDHWPGGHVPDSSAQVEVQCIASAHIRMVEYMELVPVGHDPPKVATAFVKLLLRKRVFTGASGVVALQYDGIGYGEWRFRAYYRGKAAANAAEDTELGMDVDVGIVEGQTLVLMFPFASSESSLQDRESCDHPLQPIGTHGESFKELVAMALQPAQMSPTGRHEAISHSRLLILHGPSGSGKTTLVQLVAKHFRANLLTIDCSLLSSPQLQLQDLFTAALRIQPAVLLLEDLELLFPRVLDDAKYRLVGRLVGCLESINTLEHTNVAVVGTVTSISALHDKVRQLFAEEVALEMPEKQWTADLLRSVLPADTSIAPELLKSIAVRYGQRPSNIVSLARQVAMHTPPGNAILESDLESCAREMATSSSSSSSLVTSVPDVLWTDIGGLEQVKQSLLEMVVWPLEKPHVFLRMGISPPFGMILHGPPGTGKTMLAKAAANASGCNFLNLSASDLMKAEFGESEKAITKAFDTARALSPCMVFIDEFQSLFGNRSTAGMTTSRMISQLLMEMDNLKAVSDDTQAHLPSSSAETKHDAAISSVATRVFVLAATNALAAIDPAFLQPGRFENVVYVGLPSGNEREAILKIQQSKMPWSENVDLDTLVSATEGANAASLVALCQAAAIQAMQRISAGDPAASQSIDMCDFLKALENGNFEFRSSKPEL
ncbi:Atpase aaa, partial [Globisporangium splendens]